MRRTRCNRRRERRDRADVQSQKASSQVAADWFRRAANSRCDLSARRSRRRTNPTREAFAESFVVRSPPAPHHTRRRFREWPSISPDQASARPRQPHPDPASNGSRPNENSQAIVAQGEGSGGRVQLQQEQREAREIHHACIQVYQRRYRHRGSSVLSLQAREIRFGLWMFRIQTQGVLKRIPRRGELSRACFENTKIVPSVGVVFEKLQRCTLLVDGLLDRKSTRLNSSHLGISYA